MGEMRRAIAHGEQVWGMKDRYASTIVIAASIIAAVRLARDDIGTIRAATVGMSTPTKSCLNADPDGWGR